MPNLRSCLSGRGAHRDPGGTLMIEQEFTAGHVFFRPGEAGELAYLLHQGQVELLAGPADALVRVGLIEPGEVFGEMALIQERPRALTARAVTAGRASAMTRDEFEHELIHEPARARQYLRSLFERLRSPAATLGAEVEVEHAPAPAPAASSGEPDRQTPVELPPGAGMPAKWTVVVHPLTHKAAETLPDEGLLVKRFPLRIGRATAAKEPEAFDLNDLW